MILETLTRCPVCQSAQFDDFLKVKDHTVSQAEFQIVACGVCGFKFTNPRPPAEEIGQYYESAEYISHHDEARDLMSTIYNKVRDHTTQQKINLLDRAVEKKDNLLDVGSGAGFFLSQAKAAGWQVTGTEPNSQARDIGQNRVGEDIYETIEDSFFANKKYDAITMWHVLEHVHRLNETLAWLHEHLAPKGKLFIAVPNPESDDAQAFKENWAAYDVPRHLYHFSKKSMQQLAKKHGFLVQEILPMWFDAYYVGLLSTRYQSGKTSLPQSVWRGTASNWKGRKSADGSPNTSSLIYVLGKT
ncbi:class I SAM-dependent methyltransferase [Persicitalea sp.]|uniref:class I SAM-dependent methyltransferase n=1 Tax=Persicitalea sp. TaxID=3100273 RepID=UPI0035946DFA